jgi:hypothetical protein
LTKFLKQTNVEYDCIEEVSAFLDSFAPTYPGKVSYSEFLDVVLPANRPLLRQKALKRSKLAVNALDNFAVNSDDD